MRTRKLSIRDLCHISIFTAIIAVLAQISIPMPHGVPLTMQTFAILLAGFVLGVKKGTLSALTYMLLGAIGIPVFAGFTGGLGIILGPTGGFILSFPILTLAAGIGADKNNKIWLVSWLAAGVVINYIFGMAMFSQVVSSNMQTAFTVCILPFIPTDIIKIIGVAVLGKTIKSVLEKGNMSV